MKEKRLRSETVQKTSEETGGAAQRTSGSRRPQFSQSCSKNTKHRRSVRKHMTSTTRQNKERSRSSRSKSRSEATRAARSEQPREQKTFHKASRKGHSRAATGRGRWTCLLRVTAQARKEHETPQQQAPPDMQTGQSIRACLRRGVPADHEAHSRSGDNCEESQRLSFGGSRPRRPKRGNQTTIASALRLIT